MDIFYTNAPNKYNLRYPFFGIIFDMRYVSLLFVALAFTTGAMEKPAAGGTFVDFASAGPRYSISTGQFARPDDAARQLSVGPDGLTVLFDSAREGKPYRWATISVPRAVGGGRDWSALRIRLVLAGKPTGKAKRDIALNLTDVHGETFQYYPCGFSEDAYGNMYLEYDFSGPHGRGWGGDGNHRMDMPARLSALNVHFGGGKTGRVTFRRIESADDACVVPRTVVSREPVSTDTVYPGARPFHGPRALTFEVNPAVSGKARLTLSSGSAGNAAQGRMDGFDGVVSNGVARFDLNLPYGRQYEFMKLVVKGEAVRPVRAVGEFVQTEAEAMRLDVDTGNPLHLVRDGKERSVLVVRNPAERKVSWRTAFVFRDVFGRRFEIPFAREMASGEEVRVDIPWPLPAKGLWRVAANVTGGDGSTALKETRFAYIDRHERTPIVEKPKFRFGIHYHGTHYWPHLLDLTVEALVAAGAKFTRCDYDHMWGDIERTKGVYDWAKSDAMIERLRNAGLALDIIMLSIPSWAIDEAARAKAPEQRKRGLRVRYLPIKPGTFRAFAEIYARRYGTKIDYYEIGNEIDLTGAETLPHEAALAIQREAYEGLHAGCSNVCVTTCGWAGAFTSPTAKPDTDNVGIQEAFAEHPELYDVWAQHVHRPFAGFAEAIDGGFAALREKTPLKTRPWISNETALTSAFGEEDTVARNVWMKPLFAWSRGARDYIWYNLRATGWLDGGEPGYGLITPDFYPRAGYAAFAALTTVFQGLDYDGALYSRGLRHLLRFRGASQAMPDGLVLAGWDDEFDADDTWPVRIATDATRAELCDHMGNRTPVQIVDGTVTFSISRNPQALLLFGASKAEAAAPSISEDVAVAASGDTSRNTAAFNPYGVVTDGSRSEYAMHDDLADLIKIGGMGYERVDWDWRACQKEKNGAFDFSKYDKIVDADEARGVTVLPIMYGPPSWAYPAWQHLDEYAAFVRATVRRYGKRMPVIEIWNEQNGSGFWKDPNPTNYLALLKVAYTAAKGVDPSVRVALGGTAGWAHGFIRSLYEIGAKDYFDIVNVHPYCHPNPPEDGLRRGLEKLRKIMSEHGDAQKPIWFTEIGWPTHDVDLVGPGGILVAGLKAACPEKTKWNVIYAVCQPDGEKPDQRLAESLLTRLPPGSKVRVCAPKETCERLAEDGWDAVVYPTDETYPADTLDAVVEFVRKGGTLVDIGGMPMWKPYRNLPDGSGRVFPHDGGGARFKRLRIGLDTWWLPGSELPKGDKQMSVRPTPEGLAAGVKQSPNGFPCLHFFSEKALKPGDRMVPLIACTNPLNGKQAVAACVYLLAGDMKGRVVVCGIQRRYGDFPVSERQQGMMFARAMGVSFAEGVEAIFWYNLRARELDRFYSEHHFGMVHANLVPKAGWLANKAFIVQRPAGSVNLDGEWRKDGVFFPQWRRPDGKVGGMIWTERRACERDCTFDADGVEFHDMWGKPANVHGTGRTRRIALTGEPIYFTGGRLLFGASKVDAAEPSDAQERVPPSL